MSSVAHRARRAPPPVAARTYWTVAAAIAAVVLAIMLPLFRMPQAGLAPPVMTPAVTPARPVEFVASPIVREETIMRDLAPLFLPTEWNASLPDPALPEPGKRFLDQEATRLGFADAELKIQKGFPPLAMVNGKPVDSAKPIDALPADAGAQPIIAMGRQQFTRSPLQARGGFVEVVVTASGLRVLADELPPEARPPSAKAWQPLHFLAAVNEAGLAAPLMLTDGSRVEEVDQHFRVYLTRTFRIGERLPPGFYRITVGP